jgi:hypothetical protein
MRSLVAVLMVLAVVAGAARADTVPAKEQALLLLRILAYDHNLANRVDNKTATIVIVAKPGNSDSEDLAGEMVNRIKAIAKTTTLVNNAIQVVQLSYVEKTFESDLARLKAAALYIGPGLGDAVGTITSATQQHKLLSFTGNQDQVGNGVAVGFALDDGHPLILVNLPSSRREGADLDVALLRAARIVKK